MQRGYPSDMRQTRSSKQDLPPLPPQSPPSRHQSSRSFQQQPNLLAPNPLSLRRRSQISMKSAPPAPDDSYHFSGDRHQDRSSERRTRDDSYQHPQSSSSSSRSLRNEQSMPSLRTSRSAGNSSRRPSVAEYQQSPPSSSSKYQSSHHSSSPSTSSRHLTVESSRGGGGPSNPVLDRMHKNGWMGVGSANSSMTDLNAHAHGGGGEGGYDTPGLDKRGSNDSGFSEGSQSGEDQGYFGNWTKIKKAVWGEDGQNVPPTNSATTSQGSHLWDRLLGATTPLSEAVANGVARARGDEIDDDRVGEDGETKLGRAIKQYHISKATSTSDLPDWLFSAAELKARARANRDREASSSSSSHRSNSQSSYSRSRGDPRDGGYGQQGQYYQNDRDRYNPRGEAPPSSSSSGRGGRQGSVQDFDPYAQRHQEEYERERGGSSGRRETGHQREVSEAPSVGGGSGSRATDKLRAMREAKRTVR